VVIILQLPSSNTLIQEEKAMSASKDSGKLYHDFVIAVMGHMPLQHEITDRAMQRWLRDPKRLKAALHRVLLSEERTNPEAAKLPIAEVFTRKTVVELGFHVGQAGRICKMAKKEGLETLGDLAKKTPKELDNIPEFGSTGRFVVAAVLGRYGLELAS
jgi:hypothetical protein